MLIIVDLVVVVFFVVVVVVVVVVAVVDDVDVDVAVLFVVAALNSLFAVEVLALSALSCLSSA